MPIDLDALETHTETLAADAEQIADRARGLMDASIPSDEVTAVAVVSLAYSIAALANAADSLASSAYRIANVLERDG